MTAQRSERQVTISGSDGYFQLTPRELQAFRIELYWSATNVNVSNYYNFEWYKERTLYGRLKVARGEYSIKEVQLIYQNQLIWMEESTLSEMVKRIQCTTQKLYDSIKYTATVVESIATSGTIGLVPTAFDVVPPQPVGVPGLVANGVYYDMVPGCAGWVTVQAWYDDDICVDALGNPLTRDNHGKPPQPAAQGRPPAGSTNDVLPPTYQSGGSYIDPSPGTDEPTDNLPNPVIPQGEACILYNVVVHEVGNLFPGGDNTETLVLYGKIGKPELVLPTPNTFKLRLPYGIDCGDPSKPPRFYEFAGGNIYAGYDTLKVTIVSITPR